MPYIESSGSNPDEKVWMPICVLNALVNYTLNLVIIDDNGEDVVDPKYIECKSNSDDVVNFDILSGALIETFPKILQYYNQIITPSKINVVLVLNILAEIHHNPIFDNAKNNTMTNIAVKSFVNTVDILDEDFDQCGQSDERSLITSNEMINKIIDDIK